MSGLSRELPRPRLADILARHAPEQLCPDQVRVVRHLVSCRTPAAGGHTEVCDHCGDRRPVYESCGDRHCPNCQSLETARWLQRQHSSLMPIAYFHVVFTVPAVLHPLFLGARREAFALLLAAAAQTLLEVAQRQLGALPGVLVVLHTWNQTLGFHPHVHCLITGGGLRLDHRAWVSTSQRYLLPAKVLRRVFAAKLRQALSEAAAQGRLRHTVGQTRRLLWLSKRVEWRMRIKAPFAGPQQVVAYLGRYTHRIAIGNERILRYDAQSAEVTFSYRDRRHGDVRREMTLDAREFVRRFLIHVVPRRFVRVRHFGLFANPVRATRLHLCRALLRARAPVAPSPQPWYDLVKQLTGRDPRACPVCKQGIYHTLASLPPDHQWLAAYLTRVRAP